MMQSYRAPRRVMARQLSAGVGEERALAYVMIACVILFVAQLPGQSRLAHLDPAGGEFAARAGYVLLGAVFFAPLMFYALAAISKIVSSGFGLHISWLHARLALFWSLLVITPLMLLRGLVFGFLGAGVELSLINAIAGLVFLWIWIGALRA